MKKIPPKKPVDWQTFGRFIFEQREADPGYYVVTYLREAGYADSQLKRFCVSWCAFYNLGIAARASELTGARFYDLLVAEYPTAKRASERRHFRGAAGLTALAKWRAQWPKPEALADHITQDAPVVGISDGMPDMGDIRARCSDVAQMGDYFKWKWGDLTEVLRQQPVIFRGYEKVSPKVPQQGAALIAAEAGMPHLSTEQVYLSITKQMRKMGVKSYYAPWREFDVQDAETICCVYKQYRTGGYTPGIRTAKAFARLHVDGKCKTGDGAKAMLLANQPQPLFRKPEVLAAILSGDKIFTVEELMC